MEQVFNQVVKIFTRSIKVAGFDAQLHPSS